ncbi:hypothetical protein NECAME_12941 [Necator americanus]|uniref:Uncharacterized protein n=1 Tax=Necator americanus TaxID=51031 RepID=W2T0I3_NECAM|nr:hypothetical protein NECAME_12941 [Necator americanus]ETN74477.1 hypothetical protein NECAME_12941 [Necator americanus]
MAPLRRSALTKTSLRILSSQLCFCSEMKKCEVNNNPSEQNISITDLFNESVPIVTATSSTTRREFGAVFSAVFKGFVNIEVKTNE